ncbi:betaine/proline/choline family ABC transporter ATP-binding protein [Thermosyntropha sp.]|uniref:betaine/proline/choline family ABC transporter ATP-binding protein n=1 Tax=Thermosyntropha sp. TaxID=2740820 RepID=UPI0025FA9027|nr:betaine/proline/choline family ABC transporter ATP-binding protein [Thermosyntropha sp.]MBO8158203.1 betaine/proline/choline family ABC transporter ATP-binding protein [Thermosyntropha sp.]
MDESKHLVEVKNLWKVFGIDNLTGCSFTSEDVRMIEEKKGIIAVRDVSFRIKRGEVFVVMGLSGSGKSTLARCLLRLIEPNHGEIMFDGLDITKMKKQELIEFRRHKVAMVFQHYGLLPHRTVLENVAFGLKLRGVKKNKREAIAREVIARVGLTGWESRYPHNLSGGMQQRVGIARALAQDADLLIMDEPYSGLDPLIRREMQDELIRLQKEFKKTVLFVTHDLNEAVRLGDCMAVMRAGKIVQIGSPEDVIARPANEYVQRFVGDHNRMQELSAGASKIASA